MRKLEQFVIIFLIVGLLLCFYGWTQSFSFSANSHEYEQILAKRTIKFYVCLSTGGILIIINLMLSSFIKVINDEIESISKKCSKLEKIIDRVNSNNHTKLS